MSVDGVLTLPFKARNGTVVLKNYVFSDFVNDLVLSCPAGGGDCPALDNAVALRGDAVSEAARGAIDAALQTW